MTIHDKARLMVAQSKASSTSEALSILGRRGARARNYGRTKVSAKPFASVESGRRFWWVD